MVPMSKMRQRKTFSIFHLIVIGLLVFTSCLREPNFLISNVTCQIDTLLFGIDLFVIKTIENAKLPMKL